MTYRRIDLTDEPEITHALLRLGQYIEKHGVRRDFDAAIKYAPITFRETEKEVCVGIEGNYTKQGKRLNSMLKTLLLDNISANGLVLPMVALLITKLQTTKKYLYYDKY